MRYYSLKHQLNRTIIGSYPQSEGMANYYHYKRADSVWNIHYDSDVTPNLDAIQLCRKVKPTDMLSVVTISDMTGKIVSKDFKELLSDFLLPQHRFFKARVIDFRGQEVTDKEYFLFRVLEYQNHHIDFDRSEFYVHRRGVGEVDQIDIYNADDLEKTPEEQGLAIGQYIKPRFITFYEKVYFDIFSFRRFAGYYISERLKKAIEEKGLTGVSFEPADYIVHKEAALSEVKY